MHIHPVAFRTIVGRGPDDAERPRDGWRGVNGGVQVQVQVAVKVHVGVDVEVKVNVKVEGIVGVEVAGRW